MASVSRRRRLAQTGHPDKRALLARQLVEPAVCFLRLLTAANLMSNEKSKQSLDVDHNDDDDCDDDYDGQQQRRRR